MFNVFTNNVTKTTSDACYWAPSSSCAKNAFDTDIIAGIAVAVPVISVLMGLDSALILLAVIMLRVRFGQSLKKVKRKSTVL